MICLHFLTCPSSVSRINLKLPTSCRFEHATQDTCEGRRNGDQWLHDVIPVHSCHCRSSHSFPKHQGLTKENVCSNMREGHGLSRFTEKNPIMNPCTFRKPQSVSWQLQDMMKVLSKQRQVMWPSYWLHILFVLRFKGERKKHFMMLDVSKLDSYFRGDFTMPLKEHGNLSVCNLMVISNYLW